MENLVLSRVGFGSQGEEIRVVGGMRDQGEYLSVIRVRHNNHTSSGRHAVGLFFRKFLNAEIECSIEIATGFGGDDFNLFLDMPPAVDEHLPLAVFTHQYVIICTLNSCFADDIAELVSFFAS